LRKIKAKKWVYFVRLYSSHEQKKTDLIVN
jgi:hypothetical protein